MPKTNFLLPRRFRLVGILFLIIGIILAVARFRFGVKPEVLDLNVFAVYSSYFGNKFMEIIRNNMCEEFTIFFMAGGLFLIAFSREKEENENLNQLRLRAFFISAYSNFLFLVLALFLTYGFAFVYMMIANIGFSLAAYIIAFRIMLRKKTLTPVNK